MKASKKSQQLVLHSCRIIAGILKFYICRPVKKFGFIALIALLASIQSCDTPEKVLKSSNLNYKYETALRWYNKKSYVRAIPVLEELIGLYKGNEKQEQVYYLYCWASYKQGDYMIAAYHFKNFTLLYPNSERNEECLYMAAKSEANQSPKYELDQTTTYKALEAFQLFVNNYPESPRVDTANQQIEILRGKIEKKALSAADLYYRTRNYKAAATSYSNLLVDYPDIDDAERIQYMALKSYYKFAQRSIPSKKAERFRSVIDAYRKFTYKFTNSKYQEEVSTYERDSHFRLVEAMFQYARTAPLAEREKLLRDMVREAEAQSARIEDPKQRQLLFELTEKAQYLIVKSPYDLAEEKLEEKALVHYEAAVNNYYTFADLFKNSRYSRQAERIFFASTEKIKKLKQHGQEQKN